MNKWAVALIVGASMAALLAAGCGGGGDGDGGTTAAKGGESGTTVTIDETAPPITKAVFLKRANAICDRANEKFLAAYRAGSFKSKANPIFDAYQSEVDQIAALGAPEGDEGQIEAFLSTLQRAVVTGRGPGEQAVVDANELLAKVGPLATRYGMTSCPAG